MFLYTSKKIGNIILVENPQYSLTRGDREETGLRKEPGLPNHKAGKEEKKAKVSSYSVAQFQAVSFCSSRSSS